MKSATLLQVSRALGIECSIFLFDIGLIQLCSPPHLGYWINLAGKHSLYQQSTTHPGQRKGQENNFSLIVIIRSPNSSASSSHLSTLESMTGPLSTRKNSAWINSLPPHWASHRGYRFIHVSSSVACQSHLGPTASMRPSWRQLKCRVPWYALLAQCRK